jgi:hypothetical protein
MTTALINIQEQLRQELEAQKVDLQGVGGDGPNKIKLGGKVFTLPDNTTDEGPLSAIILDWRFTRAYFPVRFDANNPLPPVCSASNKVEANLVPRANSDDVKSEDCPSCEFNQWGTADGGRGAGKACKNSILLAIIPADNPTEKLQPWMIEVSPTSLTNFIKHVKTLQKKGIMPCQVVTDFSFDKSKTWPKLEFTNAGPHEHIATALTIRENAQVVLNN